MITSVRLQNFKNFADETLRLGPFTVIVRANASGKSNIRDAFRFLHGIGRGYALRGYTLSEIIHGKYGAGGQMEWAGIRGAPDEIIRFGQPAGGYGCSITVGTDEDFDSGLSHFSGYRYSITVGKDPAGPGLFRDMKEELIRGLPSETIYTSHPGDNDPINVGASGFRVGKVGGKGERKGSPRHCSADVCPRHSRESGNPEFVQRERGFPLSRE